MHVLTHASEGSSPETFHAMLARVMYKCSERDEREVKYLVQVQGLPLRAPVSEAVWKDDSCIREYLLAHPASPVLNDRWMIVILPEPACRGCAALVARHVDCLGAGVADRHLHVCCLPAVSYQPECQGYSYQAI